VYSLQISRHSIIPFFMSKMRFFSLFFNFFGIVTICSGSFQDLRKLFAGHSRVGSVFNTLKVASKTVENSLRTNDLFIAR
jgi:hypothetical protein